MRTASMRDGSEPADAFTACVECAAGRFEDVNDKGSCKACEGFRVNPDAGEVGTATGACAEECGAGQIVVLLGAACQTCAPGFFANPAVRDACVACPGLEVAPYGTDATCTACEAGEFVNPDKSACGLCPAGKHAPTNAVASEGD